MSIPRREFKCGLIWNSPGTNFKDLVDIVRMIIWLRGMKNNSGVYISTMRVLPRTHLFNEALSENWINSEDNLITPVYYDPYPWKLVSLMI